MIPDPYKHPSEENTDTAMEITLTPAQFMALKRLGIEFPVDTCNEERNIRNIAAHIAALESILGKTAVNSALATGEPITLRVDWSS